MLCVCDPLAEKTHRLNCIFVHRENLVLFIHSFIQRIDYIAKCKRVNFHKVVLFPVFLSGIIFNMLQTWNCLCDDFQFVTDITMQSTQSTVK